MAIYDINGISLLEAYDVDGVGLNEAYDINDNLIFPDVDRPLRVLSFNVGSFYTQYHPAPASTGDVFYYRNKTMFENCNADFAGLTEWQETIGTVPASVLMNEFFRTYYPDYNAYPTAGAAMTSAFSVIPSSVELIRYATQGGSTRYYQKSYVTYQGKRICFICTHLDLTASARAAQLTELLNAVENEEYFIITGDFNFNIEEVGDSEYNASIPLILAKGYNSAQNSNHLFMTWYKGTTPENITSARALDNIITSSNIDILNPRIETTKLTDGLNEVYDISFDHVPLIADLVVN